MVDPDPDPPVPQTVEVPEGAATPETVKVAAEVLEHAEEIVQRAEPGPAMDAALKTLEEIRDGIRTLTKKLDERGGVVPAADLTPKEARIQSASNPKVRAGFFGWLDDLFE